MAFSVLCCADDFELQDTIVQMGNAEASRNQFGVAGTVREFFTPREEAFEKSRQTIDSTRTGGELRVALRGQPWAKTSLKRCVVAFISCVESFLNATKPPNWYIERSKPPS
jgi:hypothetical protein